MRRAGIIAAVMVVALTIIYVLAAWWIYDFHSPEYEELSTTVTEVILIDEHRYTTEVSQQRFSGYASGAVTNWFQGSAAAYRIYFHVEPWFRPVAWVVRKCQRDAYLATSRRELCDGQPLRLCSLARRWVVVAY